MPSNEILSLNGQLCGIPLAGPESFSQQQLDYLKRALGVDETVLWEGAFKYGDSAIILSEAPSHFTYIDIILGKTRYVMRRQPTDGSFNLINPIQSTDAKAKVAYIGLKWLTTNVNYINNRVMQGDTAYSNVSDDETKIVKIVGIGRKESA